MDDTQKTKTQLLRELNSLRNKVSALRHETGLGAVLTSIDDIFFFLNKEGIFKYFFGGPYRFDTALKPDQILDRHFRDILPQELALQIQSAMEKAEVTEKSQEFDYKLVLKDIEEWYNAKASPFRNSSGNFDGVTVVVRNITVRKRMEETTKFRALHDPLTNLPNRDLFNDRFKLAMAQAQRNHNKVALMMIDLDHFKEINDTHGHDVGDGVLIEAATRLSNLLRKSDTVARIGGDEFLLLVPEIHDGNEGTVVAHKILQYFQEPFKIKTHKIPVTLSIGIAIYPDDVETIDALLKMADIAMYQVKKKGRNSFQRYKP
jgi:diguanylate cyclase (GGDEF)-like protein/PAS domain S-box-containing protein